MSALFQSERRALTDRRQFRSTANDLYSRLEQKRLAVESDRRQRNRRQTDGREAERAHSNEGEPQWANSGSS